MPRAVIITSYLEYPLDIPALLRPDDYIVCLDGGYDIAVSQGIRPSLLLGDFDSLQGTLPDAGGIEIRRYPPEKDYTDLELAFLTLDPQQYPELLVIGGLGGRLDHTVANLQMLRRYTGSTGAGEHDVSAPASRSSSPGGPGRENDGAPPIPGTPDASDALHRFAQIQLLDGRNRCFVLQGPGACDLARQADRYLSVFALSETCEGLTMEGVKYPLSDFRLPRGISLCTSNEFAADTARIRLAAGSLLVILTAMDRPNESTM